MDKIALVIGSGGIGIEVSKTLVNKGMKVCLSYNKNSPEEKLNNVQSIKLYNINVKEKETIAKTISDIIEKNGKIDSVIYCVSCPIDNKKIHDLNWEDFQEHIDIQIKGLFLVIQALKPLIDKNHKIKFVAVLTEYCIGKPPSMLSHYITAKYGLMGFVKCMASELIKNNSTFNMVSPGMVSTNLLSNLPPKLVELTAFNNPMKRIAEPSDIAKVVSFLASEESDYLNGVNITINGGNVLL